MSMFSFQQPDQRKTHKHKFVYIPALPGQSGRVKRKPPTIPRDTCRSFFHLLSARQLQVRAVKKKKKKKKPTHSPDFTTQYIHHDHKENQSKKITKTMLKRLNSKLIFLFTKCWLFIFTIYVQSLVPARTSSRTCQPLVSGSSIFSGILVRTMA